MNRGRSWVRPVGPRVGGAARTGAGPAAVTPPIGFRTRLRLRQVLADAAFPAERWQLLAWAEHYGADSVSLQELHGLPIGRYETIEQVVRTVERRSRDTVARLGAGRSGGPFGGPAVA